MKLHASPDDCWTIIRGKVYDISKYIKFHPGGDKILLGAGKDCTALFDKYHAWVNLDALLSKSCLGYLVHEK